VSQRWVFVMTVAFLYGAAVLRSLLAFHDGRREAALLLLLVWLILFLAEPALSGLWRPYFVVNVALQSAVVAVLLSLSDSSDFFAILLAIPSMQAMQRWEPRRAALLIALFAVLIAVALANEYGTAQAIAFAALYTGANVFLASYALVAKRAAEARSRNVALAAELQQTNGRLADYARRLEHLAVARERQRLARDLHDSVTQTLFGMTLTAQSARLLLQRDPPRVTSQLEQIDHLAQNALSEMSLLSEDRPASTAATGGLAAAQGGLAAILQRQLAEREVRDGLSIAVDVDGDEPLPPGVEPTLLRIVQEALNNVVKHAGTPTAVVRLRLRRPLRLEIEDHGRGFDTQAASTTGLGLIGMKERAGEIGWGLTVESTPGTGTRVVAEEVSGVHSSVSGVHSSEHEKVHADEVSGDGG